MNQLKQTIILIGFFILFVGCGNIDSLAPEQVLSNVLETDQDFAYYGELLWEIDNKETTETVHMKEWRQNDLSRVIVKADDTTSLFVGDGEKITVYEESENRAFIMENEEAEVMHLNPKEQLDWLLEMLEDTHEMEMAGEEKMQDRPVLHMSLHKKKGAKSLFGDQEIWIDKEHWMVLRMKSMSGNDQQEIKYTTIDFEPDIKEDTFTLDLPDDVVVENLSDMEENQEVTEMTLQDVPPALGTNALYITDNNEHQIDKVTLMEIEGEMGYKDVTIDYKQDGFPLLTLSIIQFDEEDQNFNEQLVGDGNELEEIKIRDTMATLIEMHEMRSIRWAEDGLSYHINLIDPMVTWEEVQAWTEEMKVIK